MKRSRKKKEENEKETITCTNESKLKTDSDNSGEKAAMLLRLGFESHDDSWKLPKTATQKKNKKTQEKENKKSSHKIKYPNSFWISVLFFWTIFLVVF